VQQSRRKKRRDQDSNCQKILHLNISVLKDMVLGTLASEAKDAVLLTAANMSG
jgi:hypothetical protein